MDNIILILEVIGTVAFAVSGAAVGINKRLDFFGVLFCTVVASTGGGVIRDVLIGNLPPVMFSNYIYLFTALIIGIMVFITAGVFKNIYLREITNVDKVNNIFDALGLGVFTVTGMNTAINMGYGDNAFFIIFLGVTTGCGGGILRDVIINEVPFVLTKRIYAVASLAGAVVYYVLAITVEAGEIISVCSGIVTIFTIRILASVFRWDLPRAI